MLTKKETTVARRDAPRDPFALLRDMTKQFDRLFEGGNWPTFRWPAGFFKPDDAEVGFQPAIDVFERDGRLVTKIDSYGPGNAVIKVTARMLNRQGAMLVDIPVASTAGQPHLIDLPLAAFAPGEYLLEVSGSAEGQEPVIELIAFRVEG